MLWNSESCCGRWRHAHARTGSVCGRDGRLLCRPGCGLPAGHVGAVHLAHPTSTYHSSGSTSGWGRGSVAVRGRQYPRTWRDSPSPTAHGLVDRPAVPARPSPRCRRQRGLSMMSISEPGWDRRPRCVGCVRRLLGEVPLTGRPAARSLSASSPGQVRTANSRQSPGTPFRT
jgi:hypothetical protein